MNKFYVFRKKIKANDLIPKNIGLFSPNDFMFHKGECISKDNNGIYISFTKEGINFLGKDEIFNKYFLKKGIVNEITQKEYSTYIYSLYE